jgi:hypothetical protein
MTDTIEEVTKDAAGWVLHGASITALEPSEASEFVQWLTGGAAPDARQEYQYAVVQSTDRFTWGKLQSESWSWGEKLAPEKTTILEARIFGEKTEALIWRQGNEFRGRILQDGAVPVEHDIQPLKRDAYRIFLDNSPKPYKIPKGIDCADGFIVRVSSGGNITVTPDAGNVIDVCHYVSECPDTGVLRIAATRFVGFGSSAPSENTDEGEEE